MMLEIVNGYSRDFKVKFGGDKSKVIVINDDETDRVEDWRTQALNMVGNNVQEDLSREEYISPLAMSQPALPIQHYDPSGAYSGPRKPSTKKTHGGYCDICKVKLNSYLQSKSHFEGKPHSKKLKAMETKKKSSNSDDGPPNKKQAREEPVTELYCKPCNLTFTSEAHAKDHYLGRNHARVLHGLKPFEPGYFNTTTNKWQRIPPDPRVSAQLLSSEPPTDVDGRPAHQEKPKVRGKFVCELCNCSLTCEQQLQSHLAGSRHAKVLKKKEALQRAGESAKSEGDSDTSADDAALRCNICSVSFNSVIQRHQHMQSKKHTLKEAKLLNAQQAEKDSNNLLATEQQAQLQQEEQHLKQYNQEKLQLTQYGDDQQYESGQCSETMSPDVDYGRLQTMSYSSHSDSCTQHYEDSRDSNS
ncbi:Zinc finger C2H2-type [Trinorchestia longiramus]|nr:Zinc finger C2H2-type [Trinorchestia longiramus]